MGIGTPDGTYHEDEFSYLVDRITKIGNPVPSDTPGIYIDSDNLNFDPNRDKRYDKYNFSSDLGADLSPENLKYHKWIQKQSENMGRDLYEDTSDYDMQGFFKNTRPSVGEDIDETGLVLKPGNHLSDKYKKPNHPTFSDESVYHNEMDSYGTGRNAKGGRWEKDGDKWTFTPGESNLKYHGTQGLIDYFKRHEPDAKLILPGQ